MIYEGGHYTTQELVTTATYPSTTHLLKKIIQTLFLQQQEYDYWVEHDDNEDIPTVTVRNFYKPVTKWEIRMHLKIYMDEYTIFRYCCPQSRLSKKFLNCSLIYTM